MIISLVIFRKFAWWPFECAYYVNNVFFLLVRHLWPLVIPFKSGWSWLKEVLFSPSNPVDTKTLSEFSKDISAACSTISRRQVWSLVLGEAKQQNHCDPTSKWPKMKSLGLEWSTNDYQTKVKWLIFFLENNDSRSCASVIIPGSTTSPHPPFFVVFFLLCRNTVFKKVEVGEEVIWAKFITKKATSEKFWSLTQFFCQCFSYSVIPTR